MKHYLKSTVCAIMSVAILMMSGCSSDDGPKGPKIDYSQLRLGHMDLSGAVSIGLEDNNGSSRAIDGEYLSAGLYKVDAQGNISAVGVYFTTDNKGNRLEHEEVLRVVPEELHNLTDNYMLVCWCEYYDSDGDIVEDHYKGGENWIQQEVPYKNLLVRKSDGKIWCVDNIFELLYDGYDHRLRGNFNEDAAGALYYRQVDWGNHLVYKFNLQEDSSSLEQLTNTSETMEYFHVAYNGVIWSHRDHDIDGYGLMFEWPHSGFQKITSGDIYDAGGKVVGTIPEGTFRDQWGNEFHTDSIRIKPWFVTSYPIEFQYKPYLMIVPSSLSILEDDGDMLTLNNNSHFLVKEAFREAKWPLASIYAIDFGSSPGSAKIADTPMIQLFGVPEDALEVYDSFHRVYSFYQGDGYVLTIGTGNWVTKIDMVNNTWEWMKKLDVEFDLYGSWTYSGKVWSIDTSRDHFGAYWFDLTSFEEDFVNFNNLPSFFDESDYDYSNGKIIYSEQDPATGNHVKVVIDITTGAAITDEKTPEYLFETIINLN